MMKIQIDGFVKEVCKIDAQPNPQIFGGVFTPFAKPIAPKVSRGVRYYCTLCVAFLLKPLFLLDNCLFLGLSNVFPFQQVQNEEG